MTKIINIGRSRANDIVLTESYISGQHAQLIIDDEYNIFINDLGSVNGTIVNGDRISSPYKLKRGDFVLLGGSLLEWEQYIPISVSGGQAIPLQNMSNLKVYALSLVASLVFIFILFGANEMVGFNSKSSNKGTASNNTADMPSNDSFKSKTNANTKSSSKITYDFSCIVSKENRDANEASGVLDDIRTQAINASGVTVSIKEELDFGKKHHNELLKGSKILKNEISEKLESILRKLVSKIPNPLGFNYVVFLIQADELNAWTCGGRIYFTTAMYEFLQNDNEIAGIIGHEIYHNELGHINKMLRAQKISEKALGPDFGGIASTIDGILRSPFGKKDEAFCDFKGADLCNLAGFETCAIVKLWDRMSKQDGNSDALTEFTSSHPLSAQRRDCLKNHLSVNYKIDCSL
jgi:pSer/pThr/pTyr-binding forkhead associated (FHA) protein